MEHCRRVDGHYRRGLALPLFPPAYPPARVCDRRRWNICQRVNNRDERDSTGGAFSENSTDYHWTIRAPVIPTYFSSYFVLHGILNPAWMRNFWILSSVEMWRFFCFWKVFCLLNVFRIMSPSFFHCLTCSMFYFWTAIKCIYLQ